MECRKDWIWVYTSLLVTYPLGFSLFRFLSVERSVTGIILGRAKIR